MIAANKRKLPKGFWKWYGPGFWLMGLAKEQLSKHPDRSIHVVDEDGGVVCGISCENPIGVVIITAPNTIYDFVGYGGDV